MEKKINITKADIKTASIKIKVITVDNRNLTLSVFRQIPRRILIDSETHDLNGIPWGIVNYFWKENEGLLHVLWQDEENLYRDVFKEKFLYSGTMFNQVLHNKLQIPDYIEEQLTSKIYEFLADLTDEFEHYLEEKGITKSKSNGWFYNEKGNYVRAEELHKIFLTDGKNLESAKLYLQACQEYNTILSSLEALDHLFIAV